jgi:hypothetical protein
MPLINMPTLNMPLLNMSQNMPLNMPI